MEAACFSELLMTSQHTVWTVPWLYHGSVLSYQLPNMAVWVQSLAADVEFVLCKLALARASLQEIQSSPGSIIPPVLHSHSFNYNRCCITDSIVKQSTKQYTKCQQHEMLLARLCSRSIQPTVPVTFIRIYPHSKLLNNFQYPPQYKISQKPPGRSRLIPCGGHTQSQQSRSAASQTCLTITECPLQLQTHHRQWI